MRSVIFDLDGTLCDCQHRLHHVSGHEKNWDAFFEGIPDDPIVEPVYDVLTALCWHHRILLTTGRPERHRLMTKWWLDQHNVPYDRLYMRPDDDTRPDHVVKAQILEGIKADGFDVFLAVDDRQSIVDLWRSQGIVTLQCAPTNDLAPATGTLILTVGPSGGGKSTWACANFSPEKIVSSDKIREELCGDFRDQSKNEQVFTAVHAIASARIKNGLDCIIDATHLRRADRLKAVALAHGGPVRYVVIDRPMADKRRDGGWRNGAVASGAFAIDLLAKHEQTFRSQLKDIIAGDHLPNVEVVDLQS
jgi:hypothetical protein